MTAPVALLLEGSSLLNLFISSNPIHIATLLVLLASSVFSWTVIFAKWKLFKKIDQTNNKFLRACRKATNMEAVALATEQFRESPLVTVFEYGFEEVTRQVKKTRTLFNKTAVERTLQLGISEEITRLDERGDDRSGARGRAVGRDLRQSRRRSNEEVTANGASRGLRR